MLILVCCLYEEPPARAVPVECLIKKIQFLHIFFASIILLLFCCKDTTIFPNTQGYPRFLSVCVRFSESFPTQSLLCCMEICPPEKLTNVSHFISKGLFCNYQKDVAARRAATSMFWFKENQGPLRGPETTACTCRGFR